MDRRPYSKGDDLRYVDWHIYGRLGRILLKEFAREEEAEALLVLDLSGSMGTKLRGALRLAAALLTIALSKGDRVRIATAADGALRPAGTFEGSGRRASMLSALERLDGTAGGATDLDASLAMVPAHRGPGRRLTLLISDLLTARDGRQAVVRGDAVVFHWLSPEERRPDPLGRVELRSVEGGEITAFVGEAEAARYRTEFLAHLDELRRHYARHGVRYVLAPAERPVEDLVLQVLVKEGVLE